MEVLKLKLLCVCFRNIVFRFPLFSLRNKRFSFMNFNFSVRCESVFWKHFSCIGMVNFILPWCLQYFIYQISFIIIKLVDSTHSSFPKHFSISSWSFFLMKPPLLEPISTWSIIRVVLHYVDSVIEVVLFFFVCSTLFLLRFVSPLSVCPSLLTPNLESSIYSSSYTILCLPSRMTLDRQYPNKMMKKKKQSWRTTCWLFPHLFAYH